ncbi:hypothetical protein LY76DRAFT_630015 [Colletotrichum caudatum]|nr:hypothetical protein LY76DRAFT_630015 [Colletotrichum caudatum]
MDDEIANLRQQLREEKHRREEAEGRTLQKYLESCHSLSLAIQVVTDRTLTTQGDTTNPTGRIFPRRIIPWDDFVTRQEEIWDQLKIWRSFSSEAVFPSPHQLEYVMSLISPISSETGLRNFQRDTVENAVQKLIDEAYNNEQVRSDFGLQGTVTFESHTNLGQTDDAVSEAMEHMSIEREHAAAATSASRPPSRKPQRRARGKGNRADQFCIYRTSDGRNVPAVAIKYKAPHKLRCDEVVTGLESEIRPERDVINKDGEGFTFASRSLAAAVVTQLFSCMIGKGIQYGYVCTGEAFVFLHIPDDPTSVYYSVHIPNLDVLDDDENRLHCTAVAQVFAFIIQALRAEPPPSSWHDAATALGTWAVEYDDVLRNIPETVRKSKEPRASPYKPQRWRGFKRSPIPTRSRCKQANSNAKHQDDSGDDEEETPPSPTPTRSIHTDEKAHGQLKQQNIQDRPFCTPQCLLGLANGLPMDEHCRNFRDHGHHHLSRLEFLRLIRIQLAEDRGRDADAIPLYLSGSNGSLFKVRLSSYGYTLVAKCVESLHLARLQHENEVYDRLRSIQGKHVPVCLGRVDPVLPFYYDSGIYKHFLFLSWAGRPLFDSANQAIRTDVVDMVAKAYKDLHKLGILHGDAEPRNVLRDTRAEFRCRPPLGSLSSNARPEAAIYAAKMVQRI